jgi:transcriptional regulator with AAA-type ATPase domain/transcriptional regulatory protein LevR
MTNSEQIFSFITGRHRIKAASGGSMEVTITEISEGTGILADKVAAVCSQLVENGVLERRPGRPARYCLITPPQNDDKILKTNPKYEKQEEEGVKNPKQRQQAFSRMIGVEGSLSLQIQLARAAAAYPPNGMHTLILGPSGVGKSLMAEEIWRFFCETRNSGFLPVPPFVVFNCAEYADNPQLLLAQIFGYVKGAFTGADSDHEGLVSQADNGVLFLDEIHRLPASGQEMFFTLLDKGTYRPLGGTTTRYVRLMLIGATTESPESFLLETFRRRIPVLLQLPSLMERPPGERLDIIVHFLSEEAKRIKLPIHVSSEATRLLLLYKNASNIGSLKNEIQICCAQSYLNFQNNGKQDDFIRIDNYSLSRKINLEAEGKADIDNFLRSVLQGNELIVTPEEESAPILERNRADMDFNHFVEERLRDYRNVFPEVLQDKSFLSDAIPETLWIATDRLIDLARHELGCQFEEGVKYTLAVFFQQLKNIAKADRVISSLSSIKATDDPADERAFLEVYHSIIEEYLNITLTKGEINFIAIILKQCRTLETGERVGLVLAALGASSASSIAEFASRALMTNMPYIVNVPIDMSYDKLLDELCDAVVRADRKRGVIILADSSITKGLEKILLERTGTNCRVISTISPMLAVEVYKNILTTPHSVDEIYSETIDRYQKEIAHIFNKTDEDDDVIIGFPMQNKRNVIIAYCITGLGSARQIRALLLRNPMIAMTTDIVTYGILDDINEAAQRFGNRLKLIIGLINPHIEGVPFISIENLPRGDITKHVQYLINGWNISGRETFPDLDEMPTQERLNLIRENIHYFAPSLCAAVVQEQVDFITSRITALYKTSFSPDLYVRIYIHTAAMLERLIVPETIPTSEAAIDGISKNRKFSFELRKIFRQFENKYNIAITDTEIYFYLIALPDPADGKQSIEESVS